MRVLYAPTGLPAGSIQILAAIDGDYFRPGCRTEFQIVPDEEDQP